MTAAIAPCLYLVRHCQATGQEPDAPLTPLGESQAEALADLLAPLGIGRILSSPFHRARASITPLAMRLGVPIETDDRLIERVLCEAPLVDWRVHLEKSFDDFDYCLAGGESSRAATARAVAAIKAATAASRAPTSRCHAR